MTDMAVNVLKLLIFFLKGTFKYHMTFFWATSNPLSTYDGAL